MNTSAAVKTAFTMASVLAFGVWRNWTPVTLQEVSTHTAQALASAECQAALTKDGVTNQDAQSMSLALGASIPYSCLNQKQLAGRTPAQWQLDKCQAAFNSPTTGGWGPIPRACLASNIGFKVLKHPPADVLSTPAAGPAKRECFHAIHAMKPGDPWPVKACAPLVNYAGIRSDLEGYRQSHLPLTSGCLPEHTCQ